MNLKDFAKYVYKTSEWGKQSERKRNCLFNITMAGRGYDFCSVNENNCINCKLYSYMTTGLEGLVSGGFSSIQMKQHNI